MLARWCGWRRCRVLSNGGVRDRAQVSGLRACRGRVRHQQHRPSVSCIVVTGPPSLRTFDHTCSLFHRLVEQSAAASAQRRAGGLVPCVCRCVRVSTVASQTCACLSAYGASSEQLPPLGYHASCNCTLRRQERRHCAYASGAAAAVLYALCAATQQQHRHPNRCGVGYPAAYTLHAQDLL